MKKRGLLSIFLLLFVFISFPKQVLAANITFSVQKSADNVKPNQEVSITIKATVPQNSELQGYKLMFKPINASGNNPLTYTGANASAGVTVNPDASNINIEYSGAAINSDLNPVATLKYKVNQNAQPGNVTLKLDVVSCVKNQSMNCVKNQSNLSIASISGDATLKSLKIPNATLSPSFDKNVYEYTTNVKDVNEVTVNAQASDSSSKVQISNNYKSLQKGSNLIKIVVTAESGAQKTYTINVNLTTTPTEDELLKQDATLLSLKIKGYKLDFSKDEKKYFLEVKNKVKKLKVTAKAKNPKSKVKLDNPKLKIGKNTINVNVTSEDGKNNENYQVIVTRKEAKKKVVKTCPDTTSMKEWITYYASLFVLFTAGLILGYFLCKKDVINKIFKKRAERKKKKEEKKKQKEEINDTIELDTTKVLENLKGK